MLVSARKQEKGANKKTSDKEMFQVFSFTSDIIPQEEEKREEKVIKILEEIKKKFPEVAILEIWDRCIYLRMRKGKNVFHKKPEIFRFFEVGTKLIVTEKISELKSTFRKLAKESHPDLSKRNKSNIFLHLKEALEHSEIVLPKILTIEELLEIKIKREHFKKIEKILKKQKQIYTAFVNRKTNKDKLEILCWMAILDDGFRKNLREILI